jgi:photosystem II stability/assembly factor-like uncharacterized protein
MMYKLSKRRATLIGLLFLILIAAGLTFNLNSKINDEPLFQSLPENKEPKMVPNDWMAKQKLYPNSKFSHEHYLHSLRQARSLHDNSPSFRASWELAGPKNIGGRITDIAIHPDNPTTMYIGAASGGILKTTNNGLSWENVFTEAPVIAIGALTIDPVNPNVLYAGTGEANASSYSFIGNGLYKSSDAGLSWDFVGLEQSAYFGRILVDHSNSQRVFAAACGTLFTPNEQRGIYRSEDAGSNWEQVLFVSDSTAGIDIVQHPSNPDILYAAMWERMRGITYRRSHGPTSGIYKTLDGGDTWTLLENGLPGGGQKGRIGLAIAQNNPEIVYAFIDRNISGNVVASVFKTTNGGASWQQTNDGSLSDMNSTFGWYFGQIRVDPLNDNRIFMLGVDLYRSDNGGNSYTQIAGYYNIDEIYVDHHAMYIDPNTGFIVHGNDGGLYTSSNYGNSWNKINNLPMTQFYAIEVDYLNPQRIYGGTQDNNTVRTLTGSLTDWQRILGGDGFYCLVDYTNSNTIYAESQWGNLYRSTNGGNNFSYIANDFSGDRTNWSSPLIMHPDNNQTLFFGTYRVWKTTNRGNSWTAISSDLTHNLVGSGFSTLTTLAISNLNPGQILAGSDDGRVHITANGGLNWADISAGLPVRWITRVAFDPFVINTIYVTVSGFRWDEPHPYVFRSTNLGQDWESISGNLPELPVNVIIADPGVQNRLFVGTDAGIFYTENGGEQWWGLSQGIPNVPVTDLKIHHPTRNIVAGTYGCSAYKLDLGLLTGYDESARPVKENAVVLRTPSPNPFSGSASTGIEFSFYLASESNVNLAVYSLNGTLVRTLASGNHAGGSHTYSWNVKNEGGKTLASGVYIISLATSSGNANQRIVIAD